MQQCRACGASSTAFLRNPGARITEKSSAGPIDRENVIVLEMNMNIESHNTHRAFCIDLILLADCDPLQGISETLEMLTQCGLEIGNLLILDTSG